MGPSPKRLARAIKKNEQEQLAFQEGLSGRLGTLPAAARRPVRLFCQDECRLGLMPVTRDRITRPGVKPIQQVKPAYKYYYLYGAIEPETGQRFLMEYHRLNSEGFQRFLDGFAQAFPYSHNLMILDNGSFHKAKKLVVPANVGLVFLPPYSPELNPVERFWQDLKEHMAFDFYETLADLRQVIRIRCARYTDEAVASLTGYDYLLDAASALSS